MKTLDPPPTTQQLLLKSRAAHPRHRDVEDEAIGVIKELRGEKPFGRRETHAPQIPAPSTNPSPSDSRTDSSSSTTATSERITLSSASV